MSPIKLDRFVRTELLEYNWIDDDVILFIPFHLMSEFVDIIGGKYFTDRNYECIIKNGYIGIHMKNILGYFDLELNSFFD